jgi:predicted AAA+ superfamily ATPase
MQGWKRNSPRLTVHCRFLEKYRNGAILDEVQRCPELLSYLQVVIDLRAQMGRFVLTGSQQLGLKSRVTQSLAGRVALIQLLPFAAAEVYGDGYPVLDEALYRGLYPPVHDRKLNPTVWCSGYVQTYLERDVRQLINVRDLNTFQRFVRLCAGRTGQLLNLSQLSVDAGITHNTARAWISILEASYIVFLLYPHHDNFSKRLVKTPKLYFLKLEIAFGELARLHGSAAHVPTFLRPRGLTECLFAGAILLPKSLGINRVNPKDRHDRWAWHRGGGRGRWR